MTRALTVLAVLWLAVGASGRTEAASVTYTYSTDSQGVSGSFQVDSSHISLTGNTDITSFITDLSFTYTDSFNHTFSFIPPGFKPVTVTVNPMGELTPGSGDSDFSGLDTSANILLQVDASEMQFSSFTINPFGGNLIGGTGNWFRLDQSTGPVPEPASVVQGVQAIVGVALAGLGLAWRRRREAA